MVELRRKDWSVPRNQKERAGITDSKKKQREVRRTLRGL